MNDTTLNVPEVIPAIIAEGPVAALPPPETPWQRFRREFLANKLAVFGLVLLLSLIHI